MAGPLIIGMDTILECSEGSAKVPFKVLPQNRIMSANKPVANIMDNKPGANIGPFGKCSILKPPVCVPVIPAPWKPGASGILIGGMPALDKDSKCNCAVGGEIKILVPGPSLSKLP